MVPQLIIKFFVFILGAFLLVVAHSVLETPKLESMFRTAWSGYENTFFICSYSGFFIIFTLIVQSRTPRFMKGFLLVIYALFMNVIYKEYAIELIPSEVITEKITDDLHMLTQIALLASAGAGGSLLANHADNFAIDNEIAREKLIVEDRTKKIQELVNTVDALTTKVNLLITIVSILLITAVIGISVIII